MTFLDSFRTPESLPQLLKRLGRMIGARTGRAKLCAARNSLAESGSRQPSARTSRCRFAEPAGRLSEFDYNYYVALTQGAMPTLRPRRPCLA